jgi:hypothetical protein
MVPKIFASEKSFLGELELSQFARMLCAAAQQKRLQGFCARCCA